MSVFYQIVVFAVAPAQGGACERRVMRCLREHDIIEGRAHRNGKRSIAIMRRAMDPWLRRSGFEGRALARRLDALDARARARRWWSPSDGARAVVRGGDVNVGSTQIEWGVELVRGRKLHCDLNVKTDARCPACNETTPGLLWWEPPLGFALEAFEQGPAPLTCTRCGASSPLETWRFDPPAIAGELALRFGNWGKLKRAFVCELADAARCLVRQTSELV